MENSVYFLFANPFKPDTILAAKDLAEQLINHGADVVLDAWLHDKLGIGRGMSLHEIRQPMSAIVSFGGDGTLLRTIPTAAEHQIPVLGINMGHIGFLMETDIHHLSEAAERLLRHEYDVEQRMMLSANIPGHGDFLVMNDISLMRGQNPSSVEVIAYANDEKIFRVHGDGILISTPTGTTGYSISAGGPVISPLLDCITVIPVCSHVLHQRPVVLPPDQIIKLHMAPEGERSNQISMDGQISIPIKEKIEVTIKQADKRAGFIRFSKQQFLCRLRKKQAEWSIE